MTQLQFPRALDHLVLPVRRLDAARSRYIDLGFTVAPEGKHPFGTENACIFFEDGTFLEPLAIAHRETCEAAAMRGNTFVRNDQAYRFRRGEDGFSHLVLATDDARGDHASYRRANVSAGRMVRFSRKVVNDEGQSDRAAFACAFCHDERAPDAHFFTCEVVQNPQIDRSALRAHANGALRIAEVVMSEPNPSDFQYFLQAFCDQRKMDNHSFGITLELENSAVSVLTPVGMRAFWGMDTEADERGLRLAAFVVEVESLDPVGSHLDKANVTHSRIANRIVVLPAKGQGAAIAFQEASS